MQCECYRYTAHDDARLLPESRSTRLRAKAKATPTSTGASVADTGTARCARRVCSSEGAVFHGWIPPLLRGSSMVAAHPSSAQQCLYPQEVSVRVKKVSGRRASSRHGYPDCILVGTQGFVSAYWAARVRGQKFICVDISAVAAGMMTFVVMKQSINTPITSKKEIWLRAADPRRRAPKAMAIMMPAAHMIFPVRSSASTTASRADAPRSNASTTDSVKKTS
mmetsp:Transcript_24962/g.56908  ORF Transcript_24962/g.56908 Transcript_24962/m.56908 type:complete len:222 (+) Transcript_24962:275-940(+)